MSLNNSNVVMVSAIILDDDDMSTFQTVIMQLIHKNDRLVGVLPSLIVGAEPVMDSKVLAYIQDKYLSD